MPARNLLLVIVSGAIVGLAACDGATTTPAPPVRFETQAARPSETLRWNDVALTLSQKYRPPQQSKAASAASPTSHWGNTTP